MGANQSRPSDAAIQERLLERLQALQVKDDIQVNEKEGYLCVDNDTRKTSSVFQNICSSTESFKGPKHTAIVKHRQDVSASAIGEWEKELLEDAKVSAVYR